MTRLTTSPACQFCGSHDFLQFTLTPNLSHYGRENCDACDRFCRWIAKPEKELVKPKRNSSLLKEINPGFCQVCRRKVGELPGRCVMEAHHIVAVEEGGGDEPGNLLAVCHDCHLLIHHVQRTLNRYVTP